MRENLSEEKNVEIINADALKFPYETIKGRFRVVSNIPYNITTPIIFKLLEHKKKVLSMTLLMQKEVAKRIASPSNCKEYGVLSISTQLYTKPELKFTVSRKAFSPPPKVDSMVINFEVFPSTRFPVKDEVMLMNIVRSAFSQRRKTIINGLKKFEGAKNALNNAGIDPKLRPENLSIQDFIKISDALPDKY